MSKASESKGQALLRDYLDRAGLSLRKFALSASLSVSTVSKLLLGERGKCITWHVAHSIEEATGGAVPGSSWMESSR